MDWVLCVSVVGDGACKAKTKQIKNKLHDEIPTGTMLSTSKTYIIVIVAIGRLALSTAHIEILLLWLWLLLLLPLLLLLLGIKDGDNRGISVIRWGRLVLCAGAIVLGRLQNIIVGRASKRNEDTYPFASRIYIH